ncbi:hypothetical protein [Salinilacihabitans rarus]|uniref:hypothetical protein n=1 Tax=Salinilacihabitans rarus TaxID=2961596 RepID=UPI0020C8581B|nr:hypothetical protein [Salinilacihabitans rarus]
MARTSRTVAATLAVRVPVNAAGDLVDGAARIVERIDAVERVDEPRMNGLAPGLNDTTVRLRARVTVAVGDRGEDVAVARRELEAGVGVADVADVEAVDPDATLAGRARVG